MHRALVASGDPDALDVERACKRAGARIASFNQLTRPKIGDTKSVATIRRIVARSGVMRARQVLEALVKAKRAPITESEILAADNILKEQPQLSIQKLASAIRVDGDRGLMTARGKAASESIALWRAIADRWLARLKASSR